MLVNQAIATGLYGIALIIPAIFWLMRLGVPRRGIARTVALFLCIPFLALPMGVAMGILNLVTPLPLEIWGVPIEELLKLAVIVRLGIRGRAAVAIGVLFGCVEILTSKTFLALVIPISIFSGWLIAITGVVLMHGATGLVYSVIGQVRRRYLLLVAMFLHLVNNAGALWMGKHTDTALQVLAMQACMIVGVVMAAILFREWASGRPAMPADMNDGDALAGRASIV